MWGIVSGPELALLWLGGLACLGIAVVLTIVAWARGRFRR